MKKIKIFLASSEELKKERLELAGLIGHMNLILEPRDIHVYLVKWEYLDSSMSEMHKQEEYNRVLEQCDICLVLFWNRFGKYTKTEFDRALARSGEDGKKPMQVLVYFKNETVKNPELVAFKGECEKEHYDKCRSISDDSKDFKKTFLRDFNDCQKKILDNKCEIVFTDSAVTLDGQTLLNLSE